jgi:DNA-binding transcriptional LysR family regulator
MNLQDLTVCRAVVETGSFSRAAAEPRLARSAVAPAKAIFGAHIGGPILRQLPTPRCFKFP